MPDAVGARAVSPRRRAARSCVAVSAFSASHFAAVSANSASRPASMVVIIFTSPRSDHPGCPKVAGLFLSMRKCAGQAVP